MKISTIDEAERAFMAINNMTYDLRSAIFDDSLNEEQREALFNVINAIAVICKLSATFLDELDKSVELTNILLEQGIDVEFVNTDNDSKSGIH